MKEVKQKQPTEKIVHKSMYRIPRRTRTTIHRNESVEGEPIETVVSRLINNNDTKLDGKDLIYTRPEDGVKWETDIRTDKFDIAIEKTDRVTENIRNKRDEKYKSRKKLLEEKAKKDKGETGEIKTPENSGGTNLNSTD